MILRNICLEGRPQMEHLVCIICLSILNIEENASFRGCYAKWAPGHQLPGAFQLLSNYWISLANRKTAAGYDGTPVSWSSKPPALKHVVLPVPDGSSTGNNGSYSPASMEDPRTRRRTGGSSFSQHQANQVNTLKRFNVVDGDPCSWSQLPSMMDPAQQNVWDQIGSHHAPSYFLNNGPYIPTVLQPPYQHSPGPTASNDPGLCGPYWPDGRFVPYRPAAFRHEGEHHNHQVRVLQRDFDQIPVPFADPFQTYQGPSFADRIDPFHPDNTTPVPLHRSRIGNTHTTPYQPQPQGLNDGFYQGMSNGERTPTGPPLQRASNAHFKEKTLSKAHAIYVELLASIHQSRKEDRLARISRSSRNNIYPKPPRQPASHFSSSTWGELSAEDNHRRHSTTYHGQPPGLNPNNANNSWQSHRSHNDQGYGRSSNPDMPHYIAPFVPPQLQTASPRDKARQALEMLTTLCDQSDWTWIDAMLLGGCLAYGLEDYNIAIEWYSKILDRDSQ